MLAAGVVAAVLWRRFIRVLFQSPGRPGGHLRAAPTGPARGKTEAPLAGLLKEARIESMVLGAESPACGRLIRELAVRTQTGASIVALGRGRTNLINPGPDEELQAGDQLVVAGRPGPAGGRPAPVCQRPGSALLSHAAEEPAGLVCGAGDELEEAVGIGVGGQEGGPDQGIGERSSEVGGRLHEVNAGGGGGELNQQVAVGQARGRGKELERVEIGGAVAGADVQGARGRGKNRIP